jgi:hypothetical protein
VNDWCFPRQTEGFQVQAESFIKPQTLKTEGAKGKGSKIKRLEIWKLYRLGHSPLNFFLREWRRLRALVKGWLSLGHLLKNKTKKP